MKLKTSPDSKRTPVKKKKATAYRWKTTLFRVPSLAFTALTRGALPAGFSAVKTLQKEGLDEIHWKVLGDSLVRFFRDSGPVLTKLGQILATRTDLMPAPLCKRLEDLYDRQSPMPEKEVERLLRKAFPGKSPFQSFERKPLGVGSIGQVHRACLQDGTRVVVKFVRPNARLDIERDLATASALCDAFFSIVKNKETTSLTIQRVLEDLETGFLSELDLKAEAASIQRFRARLNSNPGVYIPICYEKLSSEHLLVIEELKGVSLSQYRATHPNKPNLKKVADLALKEILTQIFSEGRFHADPHAGNIMVLEDGRIGIIDFGLTGEFTLQERKRIARAVKALISREPDAMIQALLEFGTLPKNFNLSDFKRDIVDAVKSKKSKTGGNLLNTSPGNLETLVNDLFKIAYRHHVYVPQSTTILIKTLVTIEGVARSLDPEINLLGVAVPVILKSLTPKWLQWRSFFTG